MAHSELITTFSNNDWLVMLFCLFMLGSSLLTRNFMINNTTAQYISIGRKLTMPMFVVVMVSSWYGMVFGVTQISFQNGLYNFLTQGIFWYLAAALFAIVMAKKVNQGKVLTIPEMIGKVYGSKPRLLAACLFLINTLPMQYAIGFGSLINLFFGVDLYLSAALCLLVIGIFTFFGGMRGTVITDIIQFFLMFTAVGMVLFFSVSQFGGIDYLQESLPESYFTVSGQHNMVTVVSWFVLAFSTTFLSPIFYSRTIMAKNPVIAKKGILISILFWFMCDICTTFGGMYAKAHMPDALSHTAYMQYGLEILPDGFRGLFVVGLIATAFSALDTFFFVPVMIMINDVMIGKLPLAAKKGIAIAVVIILSFLFAIYSHFYIERARLISEGLFVGLMLIPLIMAFHNKKQNRQFFWIASLVSLLAQMVGAFYFGIDSIVLYGILGGLLVASLWKWLGQGRLADESLPKK